jgi:hypothetical protein
VRRNERVRNQAGAVAVAAAVEEEEEEEEEEEANPRQFEPRPRRSRKHWPQLTTPCTSLSPLGLAVSEHLPQCPGALWLSKWEEAKMCLLALTMPMTLFLAKMKKASAAPLISIQTVRVYHLLLLLSLISFFEASTWT